MTCKHAVENILALDANQEPDAATRRHLEQCPRCREEYRSLRHVLRELRTPPPAAFAGAREEAEAAEQELTEQVMRAVHAHASRSTVEPPAVSFGGHYGKWFASGAFILFGMLALPSSGVLSSLRAISETNVDAALAVSFGLIVSAYMGLFVAAHTEDLRRRIRRFALRR
ncbi:MAG: anti-sigma factor family protein [Spirochaetaceae bacterium]